MDKKSNHFTKIDKIVRKDYPFVGTIGTYLKFDPKEMTNTEAEIEVMKKKEEDKNKSN